MVIWLERDADLHMAQMMPLPLTVYCFSKIQIGFTFLVQAHLGSPGKRAVKRVCVCVCITDAIYHAIDDTIPHVTHLTCNNHNVPGWNDLVQEKHDLARQAYLEWIRSGRPHDNVLLPRMRRTHAAFKLALRYCRTHEEQLREDAYAANLDANDSKKFWKQVQKDSCNKVKKFAVSVNGAVGDDNIAAM